MKITKTRLQQIIKEEIESMMSEEVDCARLSDQLASARTSYGPADQYSPDAIADQKHYSDLKKQWREKCQTVDLDKSYLKPKKR